MSRDANEEVLKRLRETCANWRQLCKGQLLRIEELEARLAKVTAERDAALRCGKEDNHADQAQ